MLRCASLPQIRADGAGRMTEAQIGINVEVIAMKWSCRVRAPTRAVAQQCW